MVGINGGLELGGFHRENGTEEHGGGVVQREMGVVSRSGSPLALGLAQGLEVLLKAPNCPGRAEQLRAGAE